MGQFLEAGHHIYLGNSRRTEYAHNSDDKAKIKVKEMPLDVKAFSKAMFEDSGSTKGNYIGYSMGTVTMQRALADYEDEMHNYLHNVTLLAPCLVSNKIPIENITRVGVTILAGGKDTVCEFKQNKVNRFQTLKELVVYEEGGHGFVMQNSDPQV